MIFFFPSLLLIISVNTWAFDHVARIVKIENESQVYIPLTGKEQTGDKLVKYLDKTFRIETATKGMKLENGFVVTTGPQGKLKIVYNNGDHFFVSPNTQYIVEWKKQHLKVEDPSTMNLLRGAVRGLVEKGGPRSGMRIVTKNTVMGIRGTDFHISELHSGVTQVSVLRGEIEVTDATKKDPVKIEAGQSLIKKAENIHLSRISKADLKSINSDTLIKMTAATEPELKELEKKATEVTLNDIKIYEPQLYEKVKGEQNLDSEKLAVTTVEILSKTAPETTKKPDWADLLDEKDPYEKYRPKTEDE
jgi:hypothetical protein